VERRLSVRHLTAGTVLAIIGWALRAVGVVLFSGALALPRQALGLLLEDPDMGWAATILLKIGAGVVGVVVFEIGHLTAVWGKRFRTRPVTSFDTLSGTRYVLYLRSFKTDTALATSPDLPGNPLKILLSRRGLTREEHLIRYFGRHGKVVTIGRPGERVPPLGAQRGYITGPDWQTTVSRLIRNAHLVILSATPTPGTVWEFVETLHVIRSPRRLVLLAHGTADYTAFRDAVKAEHSARAIPTTLPRLPDYDPLPPNVDADHPVPVLITFDYGWEPTVKQFHPIRKNVPRTIRQRARIADNDLDDALRHQIRLPD
jgi:hypothetical protein